MNGQGGIRNLGEDGPARGAGGFTVLHGMVSMLIAITVLLTGCNRGAQNAKAVQSEKEAVPVRVMPLVAKEFVEYGEYYGTAKPVREATLQSVTGGRVESVLAAPGDPVRAGQALAHIDAVRAQSTHETAVLNERIARRDYEVKKKLQESGHASDVVVDQAQLAWLQSRTVVIDSAKTLDGALAVSPIDGIVVARYIEPYAELRPGQNTFTVADTSVMKITVGIPEADIAGVDKLHSADVRVASRPERVWQGRPVSIARQPAESSHAYEVEILVDNVDGYILSGTTATVRLGLRQLDERIVIPTSALRSEGELTYVMVANSPTARKKAVKVGPSSLTETVIESGLSAGEELIVEGINQVRDGDRVEVRN
ncbi:MAG TPA: efflux RND transporter periplasmic adaptor subunit [Spirochaetia bacterium]|nr:efflux RND transporter periplasmic adaptor subunit [Spirochaetia bacterium]